MVKGMVVAPQPEAVEAGLETLKSGGNVIDAAISAAFVQTAVDPQMCGIAGFGSMQIYMPYLGGHTSIDFHGRAPLAAYEGMWEHLIERECDDGFGYVLKGRVNEFGYKSLTTPLTLKAFDLAQKSFGKKSLGENMEAAIKYCLDGFLVRPRLHAFWNAPEQAGRMARISVINEFPATSKIYLTNSGNIPAIGDVLKNPDMGNLYKRIATEGIETFYTGEIAELISKDMEKNGGLLTQKDLAECKIVTSTPLCGSYHGFDVTTNQLPGGGLMILEMLNILENFNLKKMGHNSAEYIATVSEAMKLATIDKDKLMGDPGFISVPLKELSSKEYAKGKAQLILNGNKADVVRETGELPESKDTTHLVVADSEGNVVNLTHSLGSSSGVITEGLGFMYNNCMMVFDPRKGRRGSLVPGKARFSAMCPTMLLKDGEVKLALGAPGGTTITMGVLQGILNVVNFGMSANEAVSAPRFCVTSNTIELSNRIFRSVERQLQTLGYPTFRNAASYINPRVHAIRIGESGMDGGADPVGDGMWGEVEF
tara:strand:- start:715 stop:2331 length:1617 start_codon:yes stop_codon:yes gene_type:complete